MRKTDAFRRAAALLAALSITVSLAAPAFADTYYIDYGDITITKNEDGSQTIEQGGEKWTDKAGEETFTLPFSLSTLADYIATDRSAMMRELKRLREEGVVQSEGRQFTLCGG